MNISHAAILRTLKAVAVFSVLLGLLGAGLISPAVHSQKVTNSAPARRLTIGSWGTCTECSESTRTHFQGPTTRS